MLAVVDEHRQRHGRLARHVVEPQHAEAEVGVVVGVARGRAVVGRGRAGDVALVDAVLDGRGAHAGRSQVGGGGLDRGRDLAGVVLERTQVHHVLERPHAGMPGVVRYGDEWLCVAIRTSSS